MPLTPMIDLPPEWQETIEDFLGMRFRYQSAMREVRTKLEILDDEFSMRHSRNPIHHMESRIKSPNSIIQKLRRKGLPPTAQAAMENLQDIAGIRVVCAYLNDTYAIAELLSRQDDLRIIRMRDYIKEPKSNGYRSLHLIVEVPVFLSSGKELLPVEVQIRTIAMDFWASLEHQLRYKSDHETTQKLRIRLQRCAETSARLDQEMQCIYQEISGSGYVEKSACVEADFQA